MDTLIDLSDDVPAARPVSPNVGMPILNNFVVSDRLSLDNNPFDRAVRQMEGFNDPFECVHSMAMKKAIETSPQNPGVATGFLIQLDSPCMTDSDPTNGADIDNPGTPIQKDDAHEHPKSGRTHSDSDISSLLQSIKSKSPVLNKSRSTSLDQLVRRNQLLKFSIANSSINAFSPRSPLISYHHNGAEHQRFDSSYLSPRSRDESFDDLMATSPQWVDSEADESDIEQMCIPFLKNHTSTEDPGVPDEDKPKAQNNLTLEREQLIGQLEKHKANLSPPSLPVLVEEEVGRIEQDLPTISVTSPTTAGREDLAQLLDNVKMAIQNDNHTAAKEILANLYSALELPSASTDSLATPKPIIRQGTFNLEEERNLSPVNSSTAASDNQSSTEVSPSTANVSYVMQQLGLMNLNPNMSVLKQFNHFIVPNVGSDTNSGAPAPTTLIVVMKTPSAPKGNKSQSPPSLLEDHILARSTPSAPKLMKANSPPHSFDDDSPSSYLKTRTSRSMSLNLQQKPSSVATALAAKAALRNHVNTLAPSTPIRPTARRSSFSHTTATQPANSTINSAASPIRRSGLPQNPQGRGGPKSPSRIARNSPARLTQKSPGRVSKSPSKLNPLARRASVCARPKTTLPPSAATRFASNNAPGPLKLRLSSETSRPASRTGPMRATNPIKSVAPIKRPTSVASPQRAPLARFAGESTSTGSVTPRRPIGLQPPTTSYVSVTPSAKRANPQTMATLAAARRRTMSEGKHLAAVPATATASAPTSNGVSNLPRYSTPIKRLISTVPPKYGTANKENHFLK